MYINGRVYMHIIGIRSDEVIPARPINRFLVYFLVLLFFYRIGTNHTILL